MVLGDWRYGPVQVWLRPHRPGEGGELSARQVLGPALAMAPAQLLIQRDARGRPALLPALPGWDIGWSHSGEYLLIGLGKGVRLGVDVERLRPRPRLLEIAARFFHPEESAWLTALPAAAVQNAFFRLWCAKEAVLKAHGHGLSFGLHRLSFAPATPSGRLQLRWCDQELGELSCWQLHEWRPTADCRAAVAWYRLPPAVGVCADGIGGAHAQCPANSMGSPIQ